MNSEIIDLYSFKQVGKVYKGCGQVSRINYYDNRSFRIVVPVPWNSLYLPLCHNLVKALMTFLFCQ